MKYFEVNNAIDGRSFLNEKELKELANYYNEHQDIADDIDYLELPIERSIERVNKIDNVEEIDGHEMDLINFQQHMSKTVEELFEAMDDDTYGQEPEKFDIKIELNGKSISIPLHADVYERLEQFIKEEIEENRL